MNRLAPILLAAMLAASCTTFPVVRTDRMASADGTLDFAVVVRNPPGGGPERAHEVFVGIGKRGDNPARRYFHGEYTYLLAGDLEWRVTWLGPDRVQLELSEAAGRLSTRRIALLTFVRDAITGHFVELLGDRHRRRELV